MSQSVVRTSDLSNIISSLHTINDNVIDVNRSVNVVDDNVTLTRKELKELTDLVNDFVLYQIRQNRLGQAKTELIKIRQEIEKNFGHYDMVRRTTLGVIQANDIGIVKKEHHRDCYRRINDSNTRILACSMLSGTICMDIRQKDLAEKR